MNDVHLILGVGVLAANALAGAWGAVAWLRRSPSRAFWPLLRAAQALVVVEVVLGLMLLASGRRAADGLHLVYGIAPLVVSLVTEGMRAGVAQREIEDVGEPEALERAEQVALARRVVVREMGLMTLGTLLIVTLALRAYVSGG